MAIQDVAREEAENDRRGIPRRIRVVIGFAAGAALIAAGLGVGFLYLNTKHAAQPGISPDFLGVAAFTGIMVLVGSRLMISVISIRHEVIPADDRKLLEPLILAGDEKAIDQYVRLSSLTGTTGLATKLGLTGLPLLTVALTLIFSALQLYAPNAGFMDLAKLTLGAFFGSFVQRVATAQQATSGKPLL